MCYKWPGKWLRGWRTEKSCSEDRAPQKKSVRHKERSLMHLRYKAIWTLCCQVPHLDGIIFLQVTLHNLRTALWETAHKLDLRDQSKSPSLWQFSWLKRLTGNWVKSQCAHYVSVLGCSFLNSHKFGGCALCDNKLTCMMFLIWFDLYRSVIVDTNTLFISLCLW